MWPKYGVGQPIHVARLFSGPSSPRTILVQACQHLGLFYLTTVAAVHILLTMPRSLAPEPHRCSEFSSRSHDLRYATRGEGTLSRQLHTAPLPAPHVPVGYR